MKTLKEAYESIGTMPQGGDIFHSGAEIFWADGWYFDTLGRTNRLVLNAARIPLAEVRTITRNGKQIYPVLHSHGIASNVLRCLQDGNKKDAVDWIVQLIDAKIQEKMGDKCNS